MATTTPARGAHTPPSGAVGAPTGRSTWRTRLWRLDDKASPYAYIAPFFLVFGAFGLYPLLYTGWIALHRVEMTSLDQSEWVGWDNFAKILQDSEFWTAVANTFIIGVISATPQLLMALGLAHLLNYKLRATTFWRTVVLTPYATSVATAALVFSLVFRVDGGLLNWLLHFVGFDDINWANGHWTSKIAISIIVIWRWTGYNALIYLAGMQSIPQELYEAAEMDGASKWRQFFHVTLPGLRPTIVFTVIVSTIGATQLFGEPLLFEGSISGGISHQYQTLGLYMYEQGWGFFHLGRAAAIAWVMFLLIVVLVGVNALLAYRRSRKEAVR